MSFDYFIICVSSPTGRYPLGVVVLGVVGLGVVVLGVVGLPVKIGTNDIKHCSIL